MPPAGGLPADTGSENGFADFQNMVHEALGAQDTTASDTTAAPAATGGSADPKASAVAGAAGPQAIPPVDTAGGQLPTLTALKLALAKAGGFGAASARSAAGAPPDSASPAKGAGKFKRGAPITVVADVPVAPKDPTLPAPDAGATAQPAGTAAPADANAAALAAAALAAAAAGQPALATVQANSPSVPAQGVANAANAAAAAPGGAVSIAGAPSVPVVASQTPLPGDSFTLTTMTETAADVLAGHAPQPDVAQAATPAPATVPNQTATPVQTATLAQAAAPPFASASVVAASAASTSLAAAAAPAKAQAPADVAPANASAPAPAATSVFAASTDAKSGGKDDGAGKRSSESDARSVLRASAAPASGAVTRGTLSSDIVAQAMGQTGPTLAAVAPAGIAPVSLAGDPSEAVDRIVQSVRMQFANGIGEAQVQLNPEYLGGLTVSLKVEADSVSASVTASTPAVREWLVANQGLLRQGLIDQGLRLDRLEVVEPQAPTPDRQAASDGRHQQPDQRPPRRGKATGTEPAFEVLV